MNALRLPLILFAALAVFAGCGGSQPPISAPDAMAQSRAIGRHAAHGKSLMRPEARGKSLLYIAGMNGRTPSVFVYTYPQGHAKPTLSGFDDLLGQCADGAGNVFILSYNSSSNSSTIYEYAHGGTSPIAVLSDPVGAIGCSVDPTTGNLAAAGPTGLAVFPNASSTPAMYYSSDFAFHYCGYDDNGNLYLTGTNGRYLNQVQLVRLANGSSVFEQIKLDAILYLSAFFWPTVQWDGKHLAVTSNRNLGQPVEVYQLSVSGTSASVIRTTTLTTPKNGFHGQMWIEGGTIIGAGTDKGGYEDAFLWRYPEGGMPRDYIYRIGNIRGPLVSAVAVSRAPRR